MRDYTLAFYEKSMPDTLTWKEKMEAGKEGGFDAMEISIDESDFRLSRLEWSPEERNRLLRLTKEYNFPINTMCLSGHRRYPLGSGIPEVEARGMQIMQQAVEFAYDTGIRIVQLAGYDVYYNEQSTPTTKERFLQNLAKSARMAAANGVILALETMETDEEGNGFLNTVEKAMYYVNEINSPYLKVYPDIGNITNAVDNVAFDLRKGRGNIVAAHFKETVPHVFRNMKFGEGRVDFEMTAQVFRSMGVSMFTAEFWYDGSDSWRDTLKATSSHLRNCIH